MSRLEGLRAAHPRAGLSVPVLGADSQVEWEHRSPPIALLSRRGQLKRAWKYLFAAAAGALSGCSQLLIEAVPDIAWRQASVGHDASCAATADGEAYCWSNLAFTHLPYDSLAPPHVAVPVPGLATVSELVAARESFCAILPDGSARCWGYSAYGRLGTGLADTLEAEPLPMGGGLRFAAVALAEYRGCGLELAGRAHCWGLSQEGWLGVSPAALVPCGINRESQCAPEPSQLVDAPTFAAITVADHHACGLTPEGRAYCWGNNGAGMLGNGTSGASSSPVPAGGDLRFRSVEAGGHFTCGLALDGRAFCWGNHNDGQLGTPWRPAHDDPRCNQYGPCSVEPVRVAGELRFTALAAGDEHACAITADGRLYCWGSNFSGELGIAGRAPDRCGYYAHVPCSQRPIPVLPHLRFETVAAGGRGTCATTRAGSLLCWGNAVGTGAGHADGSPRQITRARQN